MRPQGRFARALRACLIAVLPAAAIAGQMPQSTGDIVSDIAQSPPLQRGAKGPGVLRAQVLLDRAHFSTGEIDAIFGANMQRAVAAYQQRHRLPVSGELDERTWEQLDRDAVPVLMTYRLTEADVAGPFQAIPEEMEDKAKLPALGYASAEEAIAERFHLSPALLRQLNPDKDLARAGEDLVVPYVVGAAPLPAAAQVIVDRSDLSVSVVDEQGDIAARFPATIGSRHDPLPLGRWKINGVSRDPPFHYNPRLFWDAEAGDQKARIAPGPNNPVGVVWIDLSKPHYGIHGTPEPGKIGKTQSHGCIRLSNWDAALLAEAVKPGTPARLRR